MCQCVCVQRGRPDGRIPLGPELPSPQVIGNLRPATDPTLAGPLLQAGENKPDFPAAYVEIMKINVQQCSWSNCNNEKDGESPLAAQQ